MRLCAFLAWRFLFSRHRSGFVRLLTYLSIASVGLALSAFVIVMAVMNGFDRDLQARILGGVGAVRGFSIAGTIAFTPEVEKTVRETPGVVDVTPEIQVSALIRASAAGHPAPSTREALIYAVPIDRKIRTSPLQHQLQDLSRLPDSGEILLGSALAEKLSVRPGDRVDAVILFPSKSPPYAETSAPVQTDFRVSGVFRTGYYEFDQGSVIAPAETIRRLFGLPPSLAHALEIGVRNPDDAESIAGGLEQALSKDGFYFLSWKDLRAPLFRAVRLEKRVMALILSLFGVIAVFSVLSALSATAVEKRKELATLRAMGMTRGRVAQVLVTAGAIAGLLGVILGAGLALAGHVLITRSSLFSLPADIYDLDRLPSEWSTALFAAAATVLFVLSILAATIPAVAQARKSPSVALREE